MTRYIKLFSVIFLFYINPSNCNPDEKNLREYLYNNYNKQVRPIKSVNKTNVYMGIGVQNLESFYQKEETIAINLWVRMNWKDEYLKWDSSISNLTFLSIDKDYTWVPDIELLNAASLPEIYTMKGGMNLYSDGEIMWSNPAIYKFSCSLELQYFPFDTQKCDMQFASWVYNNNYLYLKPYDNLEKQIDILDTFSHSEWSIKDVSLVTTNETRLCCPNNKYSTITYTIELERYSHYYNLSMGMTISLVIVNFIIMLIKPDNISRTSTAVFIPLTILALQLTIADKIPVVGYYTLMDYFFLCCFITSMVCSIESALAYALITTKSRFVYNLFKRCFNIKYLVDKDLKNLNKNKIRTEKHKSHVDSINENSETNANRELNESNDFSVLESELNNLSKRTSSYVNSMGNIKTKIIDTEDNNSNNSINSISTTDSIKTNYSNYSNDSRNLGISKKIIKTIAYNDEYLSLSLKEILVFNEVDRYVRYVDNVLRVLFPLIFTIIIGIVMNHN